MKPRVMLLSTNLAPGGAEAQVAELARALACRQWPASVVSLLDPSAFRTELEAQGIPVFSLGMRPGKPNLWGAVRIARLLREWRPQILHAHMFHANMLARWMRLICPVPVVISTLHSIAESSRESADVRIRDWLYRLTDALSDRTISVSAAGAERYKALRAVAGKRLRVIPNGVGTARFQPHAARRANTRRALGLGKEFVWLAAGRLMWKKDYPTMLRAVAACKAGVLLIAGEGPQREELESLACDLGVAGRVRFLGVRQDMPELMNASDAFLLSSVVEGLPMVLLEAASSGLPCVATNVGGVKECIVNEQTGFVVPAKDPAALGAEMSRVMEMPADARQRMGQAARALVLERFDLRVVTAQWETTYLELLGCADAKRYS